MANRRYFRRFASISILLVAVAYGAHIELAGAADPGNAAATHSGIKLSAKEPSPLTGKVPGHSLGNVSDSQFWRAVRRGLQGQVSIPDKKAGVLIQSEGEEWRAIRNGPVTVSGIWALLGMIGLMALYFVLHGRILIEAGPSGRLVERFGSLERFAHWLTANSFIVLALTGLNLLYGRYVLIPILGSEAFAVIAQWGKYAHNYVGFPFMFGLVLMFIVWVRQNLPNKDDLVWLARGGGMFVKGSHPPAKKFNAGQKVVFWLSMLGGSVLSLTGLSLLFPFEFAMFKPVFVALNQIGFDLLADLAPVHEMQLSQLLHGSVALVLVAVIIGHIYLGSIGMEGAFDAMVSGKVDENWARQHHSAWATEIGTGASSAEHDHGDG